METSSSRRKEPGDTGNPEFHFIMSNRHCGLFRTVGVFLLLVVEDHGMSLSKKQDDHSGSYLASYYCAILINGGLAEPQPLILCPNQGHRDFVYPIEPGVGHLVAQAGQSFRIACPGSRLNLKTVENYNDTVVTCVGNNYFSLHNNARIEESFDKISCERYPAYTARETGIRCGNGLSVEIGFPLDFQITKNKKYSEFYRVIDLCHDDALGHTIYAHTKIFAVIDAAQTSFPRTAFRKGRFFRGIDIQKVYGRDSQRKTIARILRSDELADRYIPDTGPHFLSRGHLIAKADLIYGSHQRTTFFYVNAVPMWQIVNAGNWLAMESSVRAYASRRNLDLDVWVGGYGILTLMDNRGHAREIYLSVNESDKGVVPVPKVMFKVVYNYPTRSGVVFLTANNPYLDHLSDDYRICTDVCKKIDYITWNRTRADRGMSYCCEVNDFRRAFPGIPCFDTTRLLL